MNLKYRVLVCSILVLFVINVGQAFISNSSFRLKGMGTELLDFTHDEYSDIYYNPHYLNDIQGKRLYSNLSNLSGVMPASFAATDINLLRNVLYPTNLIGGITDAGNSKIGAIFASSGFSAKFRTESKNSGTYQTPARWKDEETMESGGSFGGRDINIFYGGRSLGIIAKASYFSAGMTYEDSRKEDSFNDNGNQNYHRYEKDEWDFSNRDYLVGLSIGKVMRDGNGETSISGGVEPALMQTSMKDIESYVTRYFDGNNPDYDNNYDDDESISITGISGKLNFRRQSNIGQNSISSKVLKLSASFVPFSLESTNEDIYESWSGDRGSENYYHRYRKSEDNNEMSGAAIVLHSAFGYGREINFDDKKTKLVFGGKLKYFFIFLSGSDDPSTRKTTFYQIYPNGSNNSNDSGYITTIDDNKSVDVSGNLHLLVWNFPIGIETTFLEKFKLRLGSNAVIPMFGMGGLKIDEKDQPDHVRTDYTHGPDAGKIEQEYNEDNPTIEDSDDLSASVTNANLHTYSMGLGWQINENLTMDIIHFSKLTDLGTWWFSLGIRL